MARLVSLGLDSNQLSGTIPDTIENLVNLEELILDGNRLSGPIPAAIGKLSKLQFLVLSSNQLSGQIPSELMDLSSLEFDDIRWNALQTDDEALASFLKNRGGIDWELTQTVTPTGLNAYEVGSSTVTLTWTPIQYQVDPGGYEVEYNTSANEPFTPFGRTSSKSVASMEVSGLSPETGYYFRVRAVTSAHANNQNELRSDYSPNFFVETTFLDTDGDGMPDKWEEAYGLDPLVNDAKQDLDEDGLGNLAEFLRLTLPNDPDTDGDGYNDGREVAQSTDPKDKDSHAGIPDIEAAALRALYNSTNGDYWYYNTNWMGTVGTECTWFGVGCNEAGSHVTQLDLYGNNLNGYIPAEIGNLVNLGKLDFESGEDGYRLYGPLPAEIGNLYNLQELYLSHNQLSGSIPADIGNLVNLRIFDLSNNDFSGSIPTAIGNLVNLEKLDLSYNQLSGSIPADIGNLQKLRTLDLKGGLKYDEKENPYLGYNQLNGPIPEDIGQLTNLEELNLSYNKLSGSIPAAIGNLVKLQYLYLDFNQLGGPIPAEVGNLASLTELYLNSNQLLGEIPSEIMDLETHLEILDISYNALHTIDKLLIVLLNGISEGWQGTQTIAPTLFTVNEGITWYSVPLQWSKILYDYDAGYYKVEYSKSADGPFDSYVVTSNKLATGITVEGLDADTTYYFRIKTVTNPHFDNQNMVESEHFKYIDEEGNEKDTIEATTWDPPA
jgi:Leucine-rich repeat (LRR) protein